MYAAYAVNWQKIPNSLCGCTFRSINVGTSSCSDRSKKTSLKGNDLEGKELQALSSITDSESKVNSIYQKNKLKCGFVAYLLSLVSFFFVTLLATVSRTPWYEYMEQDDQFALHI
jgi:hypothetical protein